jgi:deoxyribodipyrimidine photo-lyase
MTETLIWWVRRDLRLADNPVLDEADRRGARVIPVFILDDRLLSSPYAGEKRTAFLMEGLRRLDAALRPLNSRLAVRRGEPLAELTNLVHQTGAAVILAEPDFSPFARKRDRRVEAELPVQWCGSPAIRFPGSVQKPNGENYVTFTPFSKTWKALAPVQMSPLPLTMNESMPEFYSPSGLVSEPLPDAPRLSSAIPFVPGEIEALRRLESFCNEGLQDYANRRNRIDLSGTSGLSPYLRFGMLSARRAGSAAMDEVQYKRFNVGNQSAESWLNELIWRDFFIHLLYHFPRIRHENYRKYPVRWLNDPQNFQAWCEGCTGYPIVDASMKALVATGWMHNRARMIVASFLTKDLLVDWRLGERWFMQHLIDGDPAANNGGWQWCAGTGADAAPYFRIFNPVTQGQRHDPDGAFVRCWLPAMRNVPSEYIHAPWTMPADLQRRAGCRIGKDYPTRIIDHGVARQRALDVYGVAMRKPEVLS